MTLHQNPASIAAWRARSQPLGRTQPMTNTGFTIRVVRDGERSGAAVIKFPERKPHKDTGFSPVIKVLVRVRAGNGDIDDARCEACGAWLGRAGGQIQHRKARGMGGTSRGVIASVVNAGLLCGTPSTGCHGRCERRERLIQARGWWLEAGQDPVTVPVTMHGENGSRVAYLLMNGTYGDCEPEPGGAA
jgi:hypothetical protein